MHVDLTVHVVEEVVVQQQDLEGDVVEQEASNNPSQDTDQPTSKFCRVCKLAGKLDAVFRSHNIGECFFFTKQDQVDLVASLNTAQLECQFDTSDASPYYNMEEEQATEGD